MKVIAAGASSSGPLDGGWALGDEPREHLWSYIPAGYDDPEPPYAIADAWEPPHPLSLSEDLCDALRATADTAQPSQRGVGGTRYRDVVHGSLLDEVTSRCEQANQIWWRLLIDQWLIGIKSYTVGEYHPPHQDLHAGAALRKVAGVIMLSDPADYEGGALVAHGMAGARIEMPRVRGTLIAFPSWTMHAVETITAGERWVAYLSGWGPPLR